MKNRSSDEEGWLGFLNLCKMTQDIKQLEELLDCFFTLEEKEDVSRRYLIIQALLNGKKPQRDIAQDLKVSISKITRGSNALKVIKNELRRFLSKEMT